MTLDSSVTFIGRLAREILRITDTRTTTYIDQMSAWYDKRTTTEVVNIKLWEQLKVTTGLCVHVCVCVCVCVCVFMYWG